MFIVALHISAVGHHFDPQRVSVLKIVICEFRFCGRSCIFRRDNLRFRRHIDVHILLGTVLVRILQNGLDRKIVCTVTGNQFVQHFPEFLRCIDAAHIVRIVIFLAEFNKIGSFVPNRAGQLRLFPCVFAVIVGVPLLIQRQIGSRDGFDLLQIRLHDEGRCGTGHSWRYAARWHDRSGQFRFVVRLHLGQIRHKLNCDRLARRQRIVLHQRIQTQVIGVFPRQS